MCGCKGKCGCDITSTTKGEKGDASPVASLGYKVYTALLTQTGTDAPTARILENTLGYTPSFVYYAVGQYGIILTNALYNKIYTPTQYLYNTTTSNDTSILVVIEDDNLITIASRTATTGVVSDNKLNDLTIEIRVYP